MDSNQLKQIVINMFADRLFSQDERDQLKSLKLNLEQMRYMRNIAFDLINQNISSGVDIVRNNIKWLEQFVKTLDAAHTPQQANVSAYFSPGNLCMEKIQTQFKQVKKSVDICVFTIADDHITEAIIMAYERGVKIRIITDDEKALDAGSDIDYLINKGITVKTDHSPYHMHHKFAIYDNKYLLNGSFNWTRSASVHNQENIIISDNKVLVTAYQRVFNQLCQQFNLK